MAAAAAAGDGGAHDHDAGGAAVALFPRPKEHELIELYLRPKIAGEPLPPFAAFIHDADVYSAPPAELTAAHEPAPPASPGAKRYWYFFSTVHWYRGSGPRSYRVGQRGFWIPCKRFKVKAADGRRRGAAAGYTRRLGYVDRAAPREKEWKMAEYVVGNEGQQAAASEQRLVLYVVSRRPAARQ